ncbi:alkyl sulfatase dimerization domain-containing protein [uncultured Paraglaciecola sp.]|uniref:alkyl/aryl-sulfatase n=1 Tax=uncultured Paraglaciecola sp. TaxID=1765024 RepID=UPI002601E6A4|nr:alkyl sulfatase dimerization domain-containing protein [uncultured Paraglaciecola sp.]
MKRYLHSGFILALLLFFITGCDKPIPIENGADELGFTAPSVATMKVNNELLKELPFDNVQDFADAKRGFIATIDDLQISNEQGQMVWDMPAYDFVDYQTADGQAPASVNPSLWRQAALNNQHGLFKLQEGIYQIRNFDLANMTIIQGANGWILVDPLTARETAQKALEFAWQQLGKQPISAILFTHSHIDHFGGVNGILALLSEQEKSQLDIIAPKGFMEEAVSENIIAGSAMARRAGYMYGKYLPRNARGHVGTGLGKSPAFGSMGIAQPSVIVDENTTMMDIDGVSFEFMYTPNTEAPAEFIFYLPALKVFVGAELVSKTLHNLYTLRGAKVRDAIVWSHYIEQAREQFADAQLYVGSHHWPVWGQHNIQGFLATQRDTYKYIHDQSVRLLNAGHTPNEIAEVIELPQSLQKDFSNRGYYGTVKHNAKAVYQSYMGWFTANPAALDPLPEPEAARRYVKMMGGADNVVQQAQALYQQVDELSAEQVKKEYRWIAQLLNQVVFSAPEHIEARALLAKTYDQLGYMAESAPWRDFYLSGAFELRHGVKEQGMAPKIMKQVLLQTPVHKFLDVLSIRLNGPKAANESLRIQINFTDLQQQYLLTLENSVLRHKRVSNDQQTDATINITHKMFISIITKEAGLKETLFGDELSIAGSKLDLLTFFSLLDNPLGDFNIVTP